MSGEFFGTILKDKDIHKRGTELYMKLIESVQIAYLKYVEAIYLWRNGEYDKTFTLRDEVIKMEREADEIKEAFFDIIFRKKAYLPQITEERYNMILNVDKLLAQIERAIRILCLKKIDVNYFPIELDQIIEQNKEVLNLFVKANESFFINFEEAAKACHNVEELRDKVRDLFFIVLGKVINDEYPRGTRRLLNATTRISIEAEEATDYLKVLIAKHS